MIWTKTDGATASSTSVVATAMGVLFGFMYGLYSPVCWSIVMSRKSTVLRLTCIALLIYG